jgi:signal transduction histidine kinase
VRRWRPSIRLRLAALLTTLFLLLGGALLGISYALVRSSLTVDPRQLADGVAERLGVEPDQARRRLDVEPRARRVVLDEIRAVQDELADDATRELTVQYLLIMAAMAMLSTGLGWFAAGRVLRPMSDITATARRVSQESLHERISLEGPDDELKQLADTFDSMLSRLEAGFERQAAFVRNASHELRTPLSVIRTEADVTLADEADDPDALRASLATVRDAGRRSERLIDALLTLAQADRNDRPQVEVDLAQLTQELVAGIDFDELRLRLDPGSAVVTGDRELLHAMVANLVENAVRHNLPGGWIDIRTGLEGDEARLEISNSGPVIPAKDAASLAEPFRRLRAPRTGDGLGLGLSIAASVAGAHGGQLWIEPLARGGLRVAITLPAQSTTPAQPAVGGALRGRSLSSG